MQVFVTERPSKPYAEVAILESRERGGFWGSSDTKSEQIRKLRERGASYGCDGLILTGSNVAVRGGGSTDVNGEYSSSVGTLEGYRVACIVYRRSNETAASVE